MERLFFILGSLAAALAVGLGAFGAHALRGHISQDMLDTFETGVRYQMYHALALFAVAFAISRFAPSALLNAAGWLFIAGILLFSASLYLLSLGGARWWGAVTPFGGVAFIAGWLCLALGAWRG